jgi:hypothetical protein
MTKYYSREGPANISIATREHLEIYQPSLGYKAAIFFNLFNPATDAWLGDIGVKAGKRGQGIGTSTLKFYEKQLIDEGCQGICAVFAPDAGHYDDLYNFYVEKNDFKFFSASYSYVNSLPNVPDELKIYEMGSYIFVYKRFGK